MYPSVKDVLEELSTLLEIQSTEKAQSRATCAKELNWKHQGLSQESLCMSPCKPASNLLTHLYVKRFAQARRDQALIHDVVAVARYLCHNAATFSLRYIL